MTAEVEVRERFIVCNGVRLHYRAWGDESRPALVLLHGLRGNAHTWDGVAPVLARRFRILALDQRGRGESDWADDYSLSAMSEDLAAFAAALGLQRFMLAGHSLGGRSAFVYLQRYPESVERLIVEDIGPGIAAAGDERIQAGIEAAVHARFAEPEEAVRAALGAGLGKGVEDIRRDTIANLIRDPDGRWRWRFDAAGLALARRTPQESGEPRRFGASLAESWAAVAQVRCPMLLLRGAQSDVLGKDEAARMAALVPNCSLVEIPASGHSVHVDNTAAYLAAVEPFLAETELAGA